MLLSLQMWMTVSRKVSGFDLWLYNSKLVPVDGRLQGAILPLNLLSCGIGWKYPSSGWLGIFQRCRKDFCIVWAIGPRGQNMTGIRQWNDSSN